MEYPNENMEEFFKNSLDKFSDNPSDTVWQDLNERLDHDKPKGFLVNWLKHFIPGSLLLLGLSAMHLYQLKVLDGYESQLAVIVDENKELRYELQTKNKSISSLSESQFIISEDYKEGELVKNQISVLRDTIYILKYINNDIQKPSLPTFTMPSFKALTEHSNISSCDLLSYISLDRIGFNQFKNQRSETLSPPLITTDLTKHSLTSMTGHQDVIHEMTNVLSSGAKRKKKKNKVGIYEEKGPIMIAKGELLGHPEFYYRAGPSFNVLNSLIGEKFSNSSIGFGYGFMQEIGFTSRLAVTSGILYNHQEYALSNNGLSLEMNDIITFPFQENLSANIVRAEVESKFLEIPLGIKYDFYQDNKKSYFINTAVKWSFHKPQQFNYYQTEQRFNTFSTNQNFGYLNAINFAMGLEKIVNPHISYQLSLGYDYNLEPIGIEKQRLNSLYIKGNLLFGKK